MTDLHPAPTIPSLVEHLGFNRGVGDDVGARLARSCRRSSLDACIGLVQVSL